MRGGELAEVEVVLAVALHHLVPDGREHRHGDQDEEEEDDLVIGDLVDRRALQRGLRKKKGPGSFSRFENSLKKIVLVLSS